MKKRIFCLLLTAMMAVSICAAAMPVRAQGAGEEPVLSVAACNVSFSDTVYLKYAVAFDNVEADDVSLLVWAQPQDDYTAGGAAAVLSPDGTAQAAGKTCLVFVYKDISAKQMTDVFYARAYTRKGGVDYYSAVQKYSILQYAYNMLGKTGAASESASLKNLLQQMLAYGAAAQAHFDYKADAPATAEFYQVQVQGGLLSDGCDSGLYLPGTVLTLTASATDANGAAFARWENGAGASVGTAPELAYTVGAKNETLTAVYGAGEAPSTEPTITVASVNAAPGAENVQVAIELRNNPGILGMVLKVSYDAEAITLTGASNGAALSALNYTAPKRFKGSGTNFTWYGEDISAEEVEDGVILTLRFSVPAGTAAGTYPVTISYSDGAVYDADLAYIDPVLQSGSITVAG